MFKTRVLAQGIVDLSEDGAKSTSEVFKKYVVAALPFMKKEEEKEDQKLKKELKDWTKKGVIHFSVPQSNPLVQRAKEIQLDAETRNKLAYGRKRIVEI